jgi:hypothetical protein
MKFDEILEACWKGYHKEGMKTMFGKRYPNCVKNKKKSNEQADPDLEEGKRIARKPGQPAGSKKHSDLYTDENPRGTITGLKFATVADARASVTKIRGSGRSHAHKIQAAVAMEQRARAAGKASAAAVYRAYINANKKTDEQQQLDEKCWTGYAQQGVKKKGDRMVPNCVRVSEDHTPDHTTAMSLAQDLNTMMADVAEIRHAGEASTNMNYLRELQRRIGVTQKQIRNLGFKYDVNHPDLVRPLGQPLAEVDIGPEMSMNQLLYKAAAQAMRDAGREGIAMDYEDAIEQASRLYNIPYRPSELPKLQAQRAEIQQRLEALQAQIAAGKAMRKQQKYGTTATDPASVEKIAPRLDRIKPATKTLEEAMDPFLDNAARELLALVFMAGIPFAIAAYQRVRNSLDRYRGQQIIQALIKRGVKMDRETYLETRPILDEFEDAVEANDGARAGALAQRIEQMIVMGKLREKEPQTADDALAARERELQENLKQWFKQKWVRFGPDGKIRGPCARGSKSEGKPKCLPQAKAQALGKKGRASAAAKKRREDPDPERRGAAKNVATKVREGEIVPLRRPATPSPQQRSLPQDILHLANEWFWANDDTGTLRAVTDREYGQGAENLVKYIQAKLQSKGWTIDFDDDIENIVLTNKQGQQVALSVNDAHDETGWAAGLNEAQQDIDEKQDACYHKVKSRYKVWPSAYASGALVQCRKKGAANWGNKGK